MSNTNNKSLAQILDAEHRRWKAEMEEMKTWGKRETRKEKIKRRRQEQMIKKNKKLK